MIMALPSLSRLLTAATLSLVLSLAMTTTPTHGLPLTSVERDGSGVIQGAEFLQLYIKNQPQFKRSESNDMLSAVSVSVELSDVPADDDDVDGADDGARTRPLNVVKLVTTGSTIVFLDDAPGQRHNETEVTSFSVTSSQHHSASAADTNASDEESNDEDDDELKQSPEDSMNEASSNFETILQPPPSTTPSSSSQPIKSLIVHDKGYSQLAAGGGGARPRSVSYSSITQTVGDDAQPPAEPAKRNVSTPMRQSQRHTNQQHYSKPAQVYSEPAKIYSEPAKNYAEPERIYSEPARVYSEPAKVYSEPAKIYSEPAKVYSEPAQNYGVPAMVYGEPAKVYSLPAGSEGNVAAPMASTSKPATPNASSALIQNPASTSFHFGVHNVPPAKRIIFNLDKLPYDLLNAPVTDENRNNKNYLFAPQLDGQRFHQFTRKSYGQQFDALPSLPAGNSGSMDGGGKLPTMDEEAEVDIDDGGVMSGHDENAAANDAPPPLSPPSDAQNAQDESPSPKVGFVVEGRNYRKYRVEEKTPDGFIVGEYGVVSNNDGSLRGVRYTADSTISPNLIYETLMKFLSL